MHGENVNREDWRLAAVGSGNVLASSSHKANCQTIHHHYQSTEERDGRAKWIRVYRANKRSLTKTAYVVTGGK